MKIHVFHTGAVCVSPALPFGGAHCTMIKASGIFTRKEDRIWLPVSAYLIECRHGRILFDCGWHRNMSPKGEFDKKSQIESLGGFRLYRINQGMLPAGQAVDEQLANLGIMPEDIDVVLLSHLDCDHVNGLKLVSAAKKILVSCDELAFVSRKTPINRVRFNSEWWEGTNMEGFEWNGTEGPFSKSFDLFGDGSVVMVNIPGHTDGQCALKVTNEEGKYVLLFADGGYATKSWKELISPGIAVDRYAQMKSLEWIRAQSMDQNCIASLANHDTEIKPQVIEL